jgi:hypothetical protein
LLEGVLASLIDRIHLVLLGRCAQAPRGF